MPQYVDDTQKAIDDAIDALIKEYAAKFYDPSSLEITDIRVESMNTGGGMYGSTIRNIVTITYLGWKEIKGSGI